MQSKHENGQKKMTKQYPENIEKCVKGTKIYDDQLEFHHKTRYRQVRFNNRVHSKHKGWLAPSVEVKNEPE